MNKPEVVITHHALSKTAHTVKDVNQWHKERWPTFVSSRGYHVGYHYVIDWNGTLTQTREHHEEGAHVIGMNKRSIGVCFMGNFDNHLPSVAQRKTWQWLYNELQRQYPRIPTRPHRTYTTDNRSCHGRLLSDDYFEQEHIRLGMWQKLNQLKALLQQLLLKF